MSEKQYDNEKKGVLFKNKERRDDKDPAYQGQCTVDGTEWWLAAWINETRDGKKYMSLRFTAKQAKDIKGAVTHKEPERRQPDFDDEIPF